jgi:chromosome segregation ATPase
VIETIMYVALGFLAAALIALLIIPAVNARAERLARRRVEALFPMSIQEMTAEKDHLRAEFAVLQRRIERKAEEALAARHQSMDELGRKTMRIDALEEVLATREARIAELEATLAEVSSTLTDTQAARTVAEEGLAAKSETLAGLETAHAATLDELASTRSTLESTKASLEATTAALHLADEKAEAQETAYVDVDTRLTAALSELDAKRIVISDLETRLMTQTARGDDFERAHGEKHGELSEERKRLNSLARDLRSEQERGIVLEARIRDLEEEVAQSASQAVAHATEVEHMRTEMATLEEIIERQGSELEELRAAAASATVIPALTAAAEDTEQDAIQALAAQIEDLKAQRSALAGALEVARRERGISGDPSSHPTIDKAAAEDLRQRIVALADAIMAQSKPAPVPSRRRRAGGR